MTNRMVLSDPTLGRDPNGPKGWVERQRQLAETTAPGFMSRILLDDYAITSTSYATIIDKNGKDLSISLCANVKYYFEFFGAYNREDANAVRSKLVFSGGRVGHPEDNAMRRYNLSGTGEFTDSLVDPLNTAMLGTTSVGNGFTFEMKGFISVTSKGELNMQTRLNAAGVNAVMYSGTFLKVQPIINLSDRGNA